MYTLDSILQSAHRTYEGNITYPDVNTDDYQMRMGIVQDAVRIWAHDQNVKWASLYKSLDDAADGDKVTVIDQSSYTIPSDFAEIGSNLWINGIEIKYSKPSDLFYAKEKGTAYGLFTLIGSDTAKKILLSESSNAPDLPIKYVYYKKPTLPSSGSDVLEMSNPNFALYHLLARLYELDTRNDMVTYYEQKAKDVMNEMVVTNEIAPPNAINKIANVDSFVFGI